MIVTAYDLDGTLIEGDSLKHFARWVSNNDFSFYFNYYRFHFSWDRKMIKKRRAAYFLKKAQLKNLDITKFSSILESKLFKDSRNLIEKSSRDSDNLVVTASYEEIVGDFVQNSLGIYLLAARLDSNDVAYNCQGKVDALKAFNREINLLRAYGNSKGDKEMLEMAKYAYRRLKTSKIQVYEGF